MIPVNSLNIFSDIEVETEAMPIVIVEGINTYTLDMTYEELMNAVNYSTKERERHRVKALRIYYAKKAKKEESQIPPVIEN